MAARAPDIRPGQVLQGTKYTVVRELGAGGMGVVYQVVKPPEIQGVLKLMSVELAEHEEFRVKFFDEVRVLAKLDHPNIVRVFDYDSLQDGTPYYVMELLNGRTVRDVLATVGRVPPRVAFEVTRQLCEALHAAHTNDPMVVHRDIKPENIFLHAPRHGEPVVKLIDFGVAAFADRDHDGSFVGTWRYAAPEQIRGERPTPSTDLYAVGLVLFEMLCGAGPFDDRDTGKLVSQAHLNEVPDPISKWAPWVPPSIVQLVASALSKDPKKRPRDAYAFAERLFELEWANDGHNPHDATKEGPMSRPQEAVGPLSRMLTDVGGAKKPSSKNLAAAKPASDRLGDVPLIGVPPAALHQGNTLKGVGEGKHEPTSPDDDALLDGLLARRSAPEQLSKKARESGRELPQTPRSGQVVIRPNAGVVAIASSPRPATAITNEAPPSSRPDPATIPRASSERADTDTFASQESDAGRIPKKGGGWIAIPIVLAAFGVAAAATFALVHKREKPPVEATRIETPLPAPTPTPSIEPEPSATDSVATSPPPSASTKQHPSPAKSSGRKPDARITGATNSTISTTSSPPPPVSAAKPAGGGSSSGYIDHF
ncbi:MAG TPA: serine/threonine-protein kinase [Labilithrix sp.]